MPTTSGRFGAEIARELRHRGAVPLQPVPAEQGRGWTQSRDAVEFVYEVFGTEKLVITFGNDSVRPPLREYPALAIR